VHIKLFVLDDFVVHKLRTFILILCVDWDLVCISLIC
jgi:hypothetical protein